MKQTTNSNPAEIQIFKDNAPQYWDRGLSAIPVKPNSKQPAVSKWTGYNHNVPSPEKQAEWLRNHPDCGIGVPLGIELSDGTCLGAIDIDDPRVVKMVRAVLGSAPCVKRGKKGETIFIRFEKGLKSRKVAPKGSKPRVEFFLNTGYVVNPPSIHPETGEPYVWEILSLLEVEFDQLPLLTEALLELVCLIVKSEHADVALEGEGTHNAMLSLTALGLHRFTDTDHLETVLSALLPAGYDGNTLEEISEMIRSAKSKGLGSRTSSERYDPGDKGPIPLGLLANGDFALRNQFSDQIAGHSAQTLISEGGLMAFAPMEFWINQFPRFGKGGTILGIDSKAAGDAIMQACRELRAFDLSRVRGLGVWRENDKIVVNLGEERPESTYYHYVCFDRLPPLEGEPPSGAEVLRVLQQFNWMREGDPILLLGWFKVAPVCGALEWRPHVFLTGPKNTGKTTLVRTIKGLLSPLALVLDGQSTEAGIRQKLGPNSRPVVLDEFEIDGDPKLMRRVVKLARSASSVEGAVARGTPEGKALEFSISASFFFAAINPFPGTAADASRTVTLELQPHSGDQEVRTQIESGIRQLAKSNGAWCQQAITDLPIVLSAIEFFRQGMPITVDSRHALNMATLLAGAFVALEGHVPDQNDVCEWIETNTTLIEYHAMAHEEDDAMACLNHLLGSPGAFDQFDKRQLTIGETVQGALAVAINKGEVFVSSGELNRFGIRLEGAEYVLVANQHPGLERIFQSTMWTGGSWRTALARLPGAKKTDTPVRFGDGVKQRAVMIPAKFFPDPEDFVDRTFDF